MLTLMLYPRKLLMLTPYLLKSAYLLQLAHQSLMLILIPFRLPREPLFLLMLLL